MMTAIGILKSLNIEFVKYHPICKGNNLCKQISDPWICGIKIQTLGLVFVTHQIWNQDLLLRQH